MLEQKDGWFVVNVKDARWKRHEKFGRNASFELHGSFPEVGINLFVIDPGKPNCRYHRESVQEDFLVLSGECTLLVNEEERALKAWDFVHCPPGTTHVFVGAGDGPCAILAVGRRDGAAQKLYYPASDLARRHGAEAPEPTDQPAVAYADLSPRVDLDDADWPLG